MERVSKGKVLFFGSAEKIVERDVKVIGKSDQGFIIRLALHIFIAGDGVLIPIQIKSKL